MLLQCVPYIQSSAIVPGRKPEIILRPGVDKLSLSREERLENVELALSLIYQNLGAYAIREFVIDPHSSVFDRVHNTTWLELTDRFGFLTTFHTRWYKLTGAGWLYWINRNEIADGSEFKARLGVLCSYLKGMLDGREQSKMTDIFAVEKNTNIPFGIISNIIDAGLIENKLRRHGAKWFSGKEGRIIVIPANFGLHIL
jgi:hypothetical protein